jgi:hypothetical protein
LKNKEEGDASQSTSQKKKYFSERKRISFHEVEVAPRNEGVDRLQKANGILRLYEGVHHHQQIASEREMPKCFRDIACFASLAT